RAAARVALARTWLSVPDAPKALALLQRAQADDPTSEAPALLASAMLSTSPEAEAIVTSHLQAKPDSHGVRLAYVRTLTTSQRYGDAVAQLETLTRRAPELAPP